MVDAPRPDAVSADAVTFLRAAGLAATRPRCQVLDQLGLREHPVTAGELFTELRIAGMRVGLSTVYRTLHTLAATGLLHVFDRSGELSYRRCTPGHHHHLVCRSCGLVIEYAAGSVDEWVDTVRTAKDFTPEAHQADVRGICGACQRTHTET